MRRRTSSTTTPAAIIIPASTPAIPARIGFGATLPASYGCVSGSTCWLCRLLTVAWLSCVCRLLTCAFALLSCVCSCPSSALGVFGEELCCRRSCAVASSSVYVEICALSAVIWSCRPDSTFAVGLLGTFFRYAFETSVTIFRARACDESSTSMRITSLSCRTLATIFFESASAVRWYLAATCVSTARLLIATSCVERTRSWRSVEPDEMFASRG